MSGTNRRIGMVSDWFLPRLGGIELHMADLSCELIARGCMVEIHTTIPGPAEERGIKVHRTPALLSPLGGFAISPRLVGIIRDELARSNYDILHAQLSIISPLAYAALYAANQLGLPAVATYHSVLGKTPMLLRAADRIMHWSHWPLSVTAVSDLVAGQLRAGLGNPGLGGVDVGVLPNGVDTDYWAQLPRERSGEDLLIVSAMRLEPRKRPMALLKAFLDARIAAWAAGQSINLVIAGKGSEHARMERFIAANDLRSCVTLAGALARDDLRALYARADIFVLPSVREAFGIAALEARCAGLPVVAMRAGGPAEFLRNGETGLLADDDAQLTQCLVRLATERTLREKLSQPDPSVRRFDWSAVTAMHLDRYARTMALAKR
jgi:glycosyltransferase involved in cell wall biosynthesis